MSYEDGWAAINLEKPERIPRTEYSIERHWDVLQEITGKPVDENSPQEEIDEAQKALYKAWDYGFRFGITISRREFGEYKTDMGHAVYQARGVDKRAAKESPFKSVDDVLSFQPMEKLGKKNKSDLIELFNRDYKTRQAFCPDLVNMVGTYVTCISGAIDLFGWDLLLLAAGSDPDGFGQMLRRYSDWLMQYYEALAETDIPMIMTHDDFVISNGPIFSPDWYREYVFPLYKRYLDPVLQSGKKVAFCSDGNYTMFIDDIADCGFHGFVMEPLTDMKYIAEKYGKTHFFIGNADTRILLSGTKEQIKAEVERCVNLGKECPGFFMAVGNHIPSNTPVESCLYYNEVFESLRRR